MQTFFNLSTWFTAFVVAAVMLFLPKGIFDSVLLRARIKRTLDKLGFEVEKVGWMFHTSGVPVTYREDSKETQAYVRPIYRRHLHVFEGESEPTCLVFCDPEGKAHAHQLPSPTLIDGKFPYFFLRERNGRGVSRFWSVVAFGVTPFLTWWAFDKLFSVWLMNLRPYMLGSAVYEKAWEILFIATGVLCFLYVPIGAATGVYRRLRYEEITSEYCICLRCGYNLRGNESHICPECGEQIEDHPDQDEENNLKTIAE